MGKKSLINRFIPSLGLIWNVTNGAVVFLRLDSSRLSSSDTWWGWRVTSPSCSTRWGFGWSVPMSLRLEPFSLYRSRMFSVLLWTVSTVGFRPADGANFTTNRLKWPFKDNTHVFISSTEPHFWFRNVQNLLPFTCKIDYFTVFVF